ncbi:unnamed protein product [Allacma fusca]|uniref:Major facilitator superfamily (MFS) profile domain-containing protein n=1 Tax=Allacma fusca TaxID=39272 RepID=A0A8J2Q659_9HEXA|nr:unnamed protein product [Allacma fusca]
MGFRRKYLNSGIEESGPSMVDDEESSTNSSSASDEKPVGWGARHTMALLGFWGFVASYAMRVNLSVAIVAMVHPGANHTGTNTSLVCPQLLPKNRHSFVNITSTSPQNVLQSADSQGEFDWDGKQQGIVLGSFFWGYVVTQIPGGMISERIGGKWPFGIGMFITALFSLLTPIAARSGMGALIFVRVIQGLGEGVTNPAMHALLARWAPPLERSKFAAYVYAGAQIGTVLAMPISGILISSNLFGGWPSVFYVFGGMGIVWFILWTYLVYDSPSLHPRINPKELSYIQHSIGSQTSKHKVPTPWKQILTSMPVLAILVAQTGHGWGLYTLLTELPTYMNSVLHFDLKSNSILSAAPYLMMWIFSLIASWTADYLREEHQISTTVVRKIFNTVAQWGPAIALVGAAYSGCNRTLALFLLTAAVGLNGAHFSAFQVNHIDIAPNHAGVMMGITNGFANLCGIAAPYTAGVITKDGSSLESWRLIFLIAAGIYFTDNLFYLMFASGEEQPWNRDPAEKNEVDDFVTRPLLSDTSPGPQRRISPTTARGYIRTD